MKKADYRRPGRRLAARRTLENRSLERMDRSQQRRYFQRRLSEIDRLIQFLVEDHLEDERFSVWEMTSPDSELWDDIMDLHYLEASRQAILEILADLNRPA